MTTVASLSPSNAPLSPSTKYLASDSGNVLSSSPSISKRSPVTAPNAWGTTAHSTLPPAKVGAVANGVFTTSSTGDSGPSNLHASPRRSSLILNNGYLSSPRRALPLETETGIRDNEVKTPIDKQPQTSAMEVSPSEHKGWPKGFQLTNKAYRKNIFLVRYEDYIPQFTPFGIVVKENELSPPPFPRWDEETLIKKEAEFNLNQEAPPPDFSEADAAVLKQLSYFLTNTVSPVASSSSTEPADPAGSTVSVMSETANFLKKMDTPVALQLEVSRRVAINPSFLSYLFRYIFDQIFACQAPQQNNPKETAYREKLYDIATSLVTKCSEHLLYEDLHYALLIHVYMMVTRADLQKKNSILKRELMNSIFDIIDIKRAALDQTRKGSIQPGLTDLRQQLQFFLSDNQHEALLEEIAEANGEEHSKLAMFDSDDLAVDASRLVQLRNILDEYLPGLFSAQGCCVIA